MQVSAPYSAKRTFVGFSGVHVSFIKVFCWAQLAMVVANLGRIPVLNTGEREFPIAFNELCLGVVLVAATMTIRSWKSVFVDKIAVTAILFAFIGGASAVWSLHRFDMPPIGLVVSLAYLARWLLYFSLYVALINVLRETDVEAAWHAVETMLVIFAVFGIVQAAFLPNFAQMVYPDSTATDWDAQGHRLVSTVLEPNIAGTMLMTGLLVQFARISTGARVSWQRLLVLVAGFTLTISRSAVVGMIFGMPIILLAYGLSRRLVKVAVAIGGVVLLASPLLVQYLLSYQKFSLGAGSSAAARVIVWVQTIRMIAEYPAFGVGFNAYRYAMDHFGFKVMGTIGYGAEGGLLFITAMTGFVGLAVYCMMVWLLLLRCRAIWRDASVPPDQRGIAIGTAASTVAIIFASVFVNALLTTFVMEMMWVLWALTFVIARAQSARAAPPASTPVTVVALHP